MLGTFLLSIFAKNIKLMKTNILVVVDCQNDFITGSLANEEAQKAVPRIVNLINNWKGVIATTRDTHYPNYLETPEGKRLPIEHCIEGTDGWNYQSEIREALDNSGRVLTEVMKSSFSSPALGYSLNPILSKNNPNLSITFVGFCTDICVISNILALKSHYPNVEMSVVSDCCSGSTIENHEAALKVLKSCQINIKKLEEIL